MKKNNNVTPTGIKGNEQMNRMRSLMGIAPINENTKTSVVELTKLGPDGKVYGIVRENHKYFIKTSQKTNNLVAEDFNYFGGLQNKTLKSYDSYSQATKQLNLEFISLNEALNKSGKIDILINDNLLAESFEAYSEAPKPSQPDTLLGTVKSMGQNDGHDSEIIGDSGETGNPDVSEPKTVKDAEVEDGENKEVTGEESVEENVEDSVELNETEKAIDNIIRELRGELIKEDKLKIGKAISNIKKGEDSSKKKV